MVSDIFSCNIYTRSFSIKNREIRHTRIIGSNREAVYEMADE